MQWFSWNANRTEPQITYRKTGTREKTDRVEVENRSVSLSSLFFRPLLLLPLLHCYSLQPNLSDRCLLYFFPALFSFLLLLVWNNLKFDVLLALLHRSRMEFTESKGFIVKFLWRIIDGIFFVLAHKIYLIPNPLQNFKSLKYH